MENSPEYTVGSPQAGDAHTIVQWELHEEPASLIPIDPTSITHKLQQGTINQHHLHEYPRLLSVRLPEGHLDAYLLYEIVDVPHAGVQAVSPVYCNTLSKNPKKRVELCKILLSIMEDIAAAHHIQHIILDSWRDSWATLMRIVETRRGWQVRGSVAVYTAIPTMEDEQDG